MKLLLLVISSILLASCGISPQSDLWKVKEYKVDNDLNDVMFHTVNILSRGSSVFYEYGLSEVQITYFRPTLPYGITQEKYQNMNDSEKLIFNFEYYTPDNDKKIINRIEDYLSNAKQNLSPGDYNNVYPYTAYSKEYIMSNIYNQGRSYAIYKNKENNEKSIIKLELDTGISDAKNIYIPGPKTKEYLNMIDNIPDDKDPVTGYINNWPIWPSISLHDTSYLTENSKTLYKYIDNYSLNYLSLFTLDGFRKALDEFSPTNNNKLRSFMKSQNLREEFKKYLKNYVPPKYQTEVKQKAEAFFNAWGI